MAGNRLLFLDGHSSHINMNFLDLHNIHVYAFPPHTAHRLQPLDVSLFAPLATFCSQELDNWIQATQALCKMNKPQFYKLFKPAFAKAFSEQSIQSGGKQVYIHLILHRFSISSLRSRRLLQADLQLEALDLNRQYLFLTGRRSTML
jgi:hypothetical protein